LLEGVTLADRIGMGDPMPEEELVYIASEIADALSFFESRDLIHRDIKPSNIMLVIGHSVRLLDFGLAKNPSEETINLEEVFRGTPHYTSPEQILNDKTIDIRSDLYSLGATLYAAATAIKPFDAESTMGILRRHLNETPAPLLQLRPDLNPTFAKLVDQCMSRHRDQRPTVGEFNAVCDILTVE
jgi:serine/threonine protein kinase